LSSSSSKHEAPPESGRAFASPGALRRTDQLGPVDVGAGLGEVPEDEVAGVVVLTGGFLSGFE